MNWKNIFENFLGNALSDVFVVTFVTILITKFFENLKNRSDIIGGLIQVESEIDFNRHILQTLLNEGISAFEKEYKRGLSTEMHIDNEIFEDAARFMAISTERLLSDGFKNSFSSFAKMENHQLFERIATLYQVDYYYRIQTSFQMGQLNWTLLDSIKSKLTQVIEDSEDLAEDIVSEIHKLKKESVLKKTLYDIWAGFKNSYLLIEDFVVQKFMVIFLKVFGNPNRGRGRF